jgi:hypothetical protein
MSQFLLYLLGWLLANVNTGSQPAITWILGDPGASAPDNLPIAYVVPLFDTVAPYSNGVDMDTYAIPILVIDDLAAYGAPIANPDAEGTLVQPGWLNLMQYAETIRDTLRDNGASITFNGVAATSTIPAINYVWVTIDNQPYRGARVALQVQQRRFRGQQD